MIWKSLRTAPLAKLVLAMAVGAFVGAFAPACVIRALNSFGSTFAQFIKFIVPFIIVGLVTHAIAEAGRSAGRMLLATIAIAYASTILSGAFAFSGHSHTSLTDERSVWRGAFTSIGTSSLSYVCLDGPRENSHGASWLGRRQMEPVNGVSRAAVHGKGGVPTRQGQLVDVYSDRHARKGPRLRRRGVRTLTRGAAEEGGIPLCRPCA